MVVCCCVIKGAIHLAVVGCLKKRPRVMVPAATYYHDLIHVYTLGKKCPSLGRERQNFKKYIYYYQTIDTVL